MGAPTKETRNKTTNQSKHIVIFEKRKSRRFFEIFWNSYPRKVKKKAALQVWLKINPDKTLVRLMVSKVYETNEKNWSGSNSKFIPHAATWLNGERWTDKIDDERKQPGIDTGFKTVNEQVGERLADIFENGIEENCDSGF